jgi:hypothetical protein
MEGELLDSDIARSSAPEHDTTRHSLTITQAAELFAQLGVPRAKRSVQRFCEQGYLDCVRIKGPRGDQFFINHQSVERYAEELRQIEAVATIGVEARHDAQQHAIARNGAPERATVVEAPAQQSPRQEPVEPDPSQVKQLKDENLNLRIDNRAKEIAISELNRRLTDDRDKFVSAMQDMSYKLGAAETRLAQLEAPKPVEDEARQSATDPATAPVEAIIVPAPAEPTTEPQPVAEPDAPPKKSWWPW